MKKFTYLSLILCIAGLALISCSKKSPGEPVDATATRTATATCTGTQQAPSATFTATTTATMSCADNPLLGMACDGPDTDLCEEGVWTCDEGGNLICNDYTSNNIEVCNGADDDCDGIADNGVTPPAGLCGTLGVCASAPAVCNGIGGWICQYPVTHEDVETTCDDGLDNDCDGFADCDDTDCACHYFTATATGTPTCTVTVTVTDTETAASTPTATCTGTNTPYPYSELITVPAGTFYQTNANNPGAENFSSTVSEFKIGQYIVTYDLWYLVLTWAADNGYTFQNAGMEGHGGTIGTVPTAAKYQPVTYINWRDTIVWCNAYSEKSGLQACYKYLGAVIKDSTNANAAACDGAVCEWANNGYRLPAESEYQYAASWKGADSADGAVEFPSGSGNYWTPYNYASGASADVSDAAATGLVAWYNANCADTQAVGGKLPNKLGIFDMSGNIWVWCWDFYGSYPTADQTDYRGPATGPNRVHKAGVYFNDANGVMIGVRVPYGPYDAPNYVGFRIARTY